MSLVLEVPPETEAELRALALARGQDVATFLVQSARRGQRAVYSLEEAATEIGVARAFLQEQAGRGELASVWVRGELFLVHDARLEALQRAQRARESALVEIMRLNQELGLYDG